MRILIDVPAGRIQREVIDALIRVHHIVEHGSATVAAGRFDVVIVGSIDVASRVMREHPTTAVIAFMREGDVGGRIRALELGVADAIDRSFLGAQCVARIGSAGRRGALLPRLIERFVVDGLTIDLSAHSCMRDGSEYQLTRREVDIIRFLWRRSRGVVSRQDLLEYVWRVSPNNETRAVDVAIAELRRKLERDPSSPTIIVTVRGLGYRWARETPARILTYG